MEAKDTVMKSDKLRKIEYAQDSIEETNLAIAEAQAEISFKAGIREVVMGSRELLECADELIMVVEDKDYDIDAFTTQPLKNAIRKWQTKLKEVGDRLTQSRIEEEK